MSHLQHKFRKVGKQEVCLVCDLRRENYYGVPLHQRNGVPYGNYLPNCLNIEELNKQFENLEF